MYLHGICRAHSLNNCSRLLNILVRRQEMLHKFFLFVPFIVIKVRNTLEDLLVVLKDIPKAYSFFPFKEG